MSSSIKAYRFCLRCTPVQEKQLRRYAGSLRWLWNKALATQKERHATGEKYSNYASMCKWLTEWRSNESTSWLSQTPSQAQQQVLKNLDKAYQRFFKKCGGFPSVKKYGENPGIRFPDPKQFEIDQVNGRIKLPKLGWLRLRLSQAVSGELRNASLTQEGRKWFVSLQVTQGDTAKALDMTPTLGIDMGLAVFAATSAGQMIEPLKAMARKQCRLKRYQRSVSRKVKGSQNRKKAVKKLAALHLKIRNERADWLHKLTTRLAAEHPVIAIEDLRIKNMSASAKGTSEAPGKNVRQKAGLNRGILDAAWGEFFRQLEYKVQWQGGRLFCVNPAYSSRTCRVCGHEAKENRQTQCAFLCTACGHCENADLHASQVILARGKTAYAVEKAASQKIESDPTNLAAGHAASVCGGVVRRSKRASASVAAPVKQKLTEVTKHEVSHA